MRAESGRLVQIQNNGGIGITASQALRCSLRGHRPALRPQHSRRPSECRGAAPLEAGTSTAPGALFTLGSGFERFIRLNAGAADQQGDSITVLGELARGQMRHSLPSPPDGAPADTHRRPSTKLARTHAQTTGAHEGDRPCRARASFCRKASRPMPAESPAVNPPSPVRSRGSPP